MQPCKEGKSSEGGPDADIGQDPTHDRQVAHLAAGVGVCRTTAVRSDLDASQRFCTEVLDFVVVMDVGYGRIACTLARNLR
ncbi:MAG: hypothetical protein K0S98_2319 [Propionibacteriaceae bacterium]|nr:hypothetical protein [Propionibacteriaceae bacterium]